MVNIAMLGYGVVGSGVAELILRNKYKFKDELDEELVLSKILVKNMKRHMSNKNVGLLTDNIEDIFKAKVDIVVEAMGGLDPSYEYVKMALNMKKHVVTANKDLIAEYGYELLKLARKNGVTIHFEASVGGGIPILKSINECLVGNQIRSIKSILNGTTNFILSKMNHNGMSYESALKLAQKLGFAEANPESDVKGYDAARKLSILSTIAYNRRVSWKDINIEGIVKIDSEDFRYAKHKKCNIKLLGISKVCGDKIYASVMPVMVKEDSVLGRIEDEYNAILVEGDAVGDVMFSGKGAGMFPTASAVFGDIADIIEHKKEKSIIFSAEKANINKNLESKSNWFMRVKTCDRMKIIESISVNFKNCYILSNGFCGNKNEVAAFVSADNEDVLNDYIEKMKSDKYAQSVKKFLVLDK
ncbi:homoserine dehydrogenase [Clostridium luticellarii]|jgi:homoserine dehydrogenase|uniref:Homoserine dehydrogenase n=1 Tax=Clostridium luticellarii TaxID=1691940 RepID=A0A2T0BPD6_9CLOT|nr:homoserine dehydrogenase [Clostridium luticellarii]MCI1945013.1 homoserine dehydrogenase [Clostridium luticellarii]MCI1967588.1 homoserine dehydrogenase [Clostridium luticellarii]MCI1995714.1 homoserine dehydrogenase [Clostridium luticellarii]MCI2040052.1 homoserine dehydrogenase [Clostridium luticellarii]PRR85744.1 Homoserine dehydrogenase [Clostridium luticellarii]